MKIRLFMLLALTALCAVILCATACAKDSFALVSPGLNVLASRCDMAKTTLKGDNIGFSQDDFERALNLSYVDSVTLVTVPEASCGTLMLGSAQVDANQTVSGANLSLLTFVPAGDSVECGSFSFIAGENGYAINCNLYFLDEVNYCPTVSLTPESTLTVHTHNDVSAMGKLEAYDPDGDSVVFEIVSFPENGSLILTDRTSGTYVYTPKAGYSGTDGFSYVARDLYGNYSAAANVNVNVAERTSSVVFGDIENCNVYNAALTMAEKSVMTGTDVQGVTYFNPDQTISRAEFLSTAMRAAGITDPGTEITTVFADDAEIPGSMKGYINTAYRLGFINGSEIDGKLCFLPNTTVTRAEAAVMINNIISSDHNVEMPVILPVFADKSDLPTWASDAMYCMDSLGVIAPVDGYASPEANVTRGDAAQMFEAVIELYK